jgi:CHAT domain-containing protein
MDNSVSEAEDLYEGAYSEWRIIHQKDEVEVAVVLQCMAQTASRLGEYEKAIDLYEQSLEIRERIFGKVHARVAVLYHNLGNAYCYSDRYESAAESYLKALEIYEVVSPDDHSTIADILMNLATAYSEFGKYDKAVENLGTAISLRKKFDSPYSLELVRYFSVLSVAYAYQGEFIKADAALKELAVICERNNLLDGANVAQLKLNEARVLIMKKAGSDAIFKALQAGISAIASVALDWRAYPNATSTSEPLLLQQIILVKSKFLTEYSRDLPDNKDFLTASLQGYELAATLSNRLRDEYEDPDDKLFLSGNGSLYLQDALNCAFDLWRKTGDQQYISRAFHLMETCKFQLLLEFFRKSRVPGSADVNKDSVKRWDDLRRRCTELDYLLALPGLSPDSLRLYQTELVELRIQQRSIQDSLEASSRLFKTVYGQQSTIALDSLRTLIPKNAAILSYSLADSAIYTIMVNAEEITFRQTELPLYFSDSISQWLQLCRKPVEDDRETSEFGRLGYSLYDVLLKPEVERLSGTNRLLLIPDGILGNLPFEALLTEPPSPKSSNFSKLPFLVRKFSCYYAASATLWCDQQSVQFGALPIECLGLAWGKDSVDSLPGIRGKIQGLEGTERELETLQDLIQGKFLIAGQATEASFKAWASKYGILHLALHARATEADPQILFPSGGNSKEDGILHFHELFPLDLHARLAVLSACETGRGKLIQGEGIQSISSGFAAAGIPSLIMSLWEVDDKAGSAIIRSFYEGIGSGKTIDESMQLAKLQYLENARGNKAAPYYWSAFVPMGNMAPLHIKAPDSHSWWMVLAGGVLCLCIFISIRIYVKNRKSI